jgi:hypothetical protein
MVDEALGPRRQRARPVATKAGGGMHARAAGFSHGYSGRIAVTKTGAKPRYQK